MKLKTLKLLFKPNIVKQSLKNLWEIVEYNLNVPDINEVFNDYIKQYGVPALIKACFKWLVEEVLPRWSRELTEGHALHISEIKWNGIHEE